MIEVELRIYEPTADHRDLLVRLMTLPGVDLIATQTLISEICTDMSRFSDAAHLAIWAALCPGNSESAGKRHSGRTRKGNHYLRRMLVQSAWAVAHCRDCALTALLLRVASHAGLRKAAVAVAHGILVLASYAIRGGTRYRDVGGDIYARRNPEPAARRLKRRLEKIGFEVSISQQLTPRQQGPLPGQTCTRCNGWGIARIQAKKQTSAAPEDASSSKYGVHRGCEFRGIAFWRDMENARHPCGVAGVLWSGTAKVTGRLR